MGGLFAAGSPKNPYETSSADCFSRFLARRLADYPPHLRPVTRFARCFLRQGDLIPRLVAVSAASGVRAALCSAWLSGLRTAWRGEFPVSQSK